MATNVSIAIALVVGLGMIAQWLAWRTRLPAIILLAAVGLVAGPVLGILHPIEVFGPVVEPVIDLCVAVILFEGGLNLQFREIRGAATGVRRLVYLGIPLSWTLGSIAAHMLGGLSWPVAWLFGAIIVVTGPTVIIPLLRHSMLNRRAASYLRWEGIINDPLGALLAVLVFQYIVYTGEGAAYGDVLRGLGLAVATAFVLGGGVAYLAGQAFHRGWVPEYLKSPLSLALVLLVYVAANTAQSNAGLLAVTIMGVVMGNMDLPSIQEMRRFKEYVTILLVSVVFILLSASLEPEALRRLDWRSAALIAGLVLVVRPLAVMLATLRSGMDWRNRALVAWVAPRGIVAAATAGVFAPRLLAAGYADAEVLVPLVFALIFVTVLLHGTTLGTFARWLGLASSARNRVLIVGASPWSTDLALTLKDVGVETLTVDGSWHRLRSARLAGLAVYYGEILSEAAQLNLDLSDVGTLLALTSNDAYNALVCTAFAPEIGRERVLQLPMFAADDADPRALTRTVRGRIAFDESALYEELWRRHSQGWKFQKTRLTETFGFEDYLKDCAEGTFTLMLVRADGAISVHSPQAPISPKAGETVVCFGPPRARSAGREVGENERVSEQDER